MRRIFMDRIAEFDIFDFPETLVHLISAVCCGFRRLSSFVMFYAGYVVDAVLHAWHHARGYPVFCHFIALEITFVFDFRQLFIH
ncbi:Uncharacterised protein [Mycobacteroides abscessus subsp. abscessus]|nr:Uncharacterised protein [Mycobacteroides abscessus subsp. abscessus]